MTDVILKQTLNDGDVCYENGDLLMNGGLETAAYLSLFGGNNNDGGFDDTTYSWWPNFAEADPTFQYRSETQALLDSAPLTSASLLRIEDASKRDLQWLIDTGRAKRITSIASVPTVDWLQLDITINDTSITFVEKVNG